MRATRFTNRTEAGRALARLLTERRREYGLDGDDVVVVGLPRGGLPVAVEIALELGAPLDVILVRKLGVPFQPEVAMGAIGEGDVRVLNRDVLRIAEISMDRVDEVAAQERAELRRRGQMYRAGRARHPLAGKTVLIVDDGIATGSTAKAACQVARAEGASRIVLAVPVAPSDWAERLAADADDMIAVSTPANFRNVGQFYRDFSQTPDDDVIAALNRAARARLHTGATDEDVTVRVGNVQLGGHLTIPARAVGLVVFAHGSGSSRHSPRNRFVASVLNQAGFATLVFDLLTPAEEMVRSNVFDCELLGQRLVAVTHEIRRHPRLRHLEVGFFGSSTGAAAALLAGSAPNSDVAAIVSRGGRSDLVGEAVRNVAAPTLFIVGSEDVDVLALNKQTKNAMPGESRVQVIQDATHLFEEPGTLRAAADAATAWFLDHLAPAAATS